MSALDTGDPNRRSQNDDAVKTLSTGLGNLDDALLQKGLLPGSVVSVKSPPESSGGLMVANMIAKRPAYYFTIGRSGDHIKSIIKELDNVNIDQVQMTTVESDAPLQNLRDVIEDADLPQRATVIVDPVNELETMGLVRYKAFLREFNEAIEECGGVGIVHCVEQRREPDHRWLTQYFSETAFRVVHTSTDEMVQDYLSIEKLHPMQGLDDSGARVFELDNDLNIDITTSRNISP
jgi:hypothetical protein